MLLFSLIFGLTLTFKSAMASELAQDPVTGIRLSAEIAQDQQQRILADLNYLADSQIRSQDPNTTRVLGIKELTSETLTRWIAERISVIVSDTLDLSQVVRKLPENYLYPNPDLLPRLGTKGFSSDIAASMSRPVLEVEGKSNVIKISGGASATLMTNIGVGIYLKGKTKNVLYAMEIPGLPLIKIQSPRVGIVRVGDEYFAPSLKNFGAEEENVHTEAYIIQRLGTLFHEARHSDGHGISLGFAHAECPVGHDFEGFKACDRSQNGSYTVGALMIQAFLKTCKNCSVAEREALKLKALDSFNRVLPSLNENGEELPTKDWDPAPEGRR